MFNIFAEFIRWTPRRFSIKMRMELKLVKLTLLMIDNLQLNKNCCLHRMFGCWGSLSVFVAVRQLISMTANKKLK